MAVLGPGLQFLALSLVLYLPQVELGMENGSAEAGLESGTVVVGLSLDSFKSRNVGALR